MMPFTCHFGNDTIIGKKYINGSQGLESIKEDD